MAARLGYDKLLAGGTVLDAVEEAVRSMELDENFNAGLTFYDNLFRYVTGLTPIDDWKPIS